MRVQRSACWPSSRLLLTPRAPQPFLCYDRAMKVAPYWSHIVGSLRGSRRRGHGRYDDGVAVGDIGTDAVHRAKQVLEQEVGATTGNVVRRRNDGSVYNHAATSQPGFAAPVPGQQATLGRTGSAIPAAMAPPPGGAAAILSFMGRQAIGFWHDMRWLIIATRTKGPVIGPTAPFRCWRAHKRSEKHVIDAQKMLHRVRRPIDSDALSQAELKVFARHASKAVVTEAELEGAVATSSTPAQPKEYLTEEDAALCTHLGYECAAEDLLHHLSVGDDPITRLYSTYPWLGRMVGLAIVGLLVGGLITAVIIIALNWYKYSYRNTMVTYNDIAYEQVLVDAAEVYLNLVREQTGFNVSLDVSTSYGGAEGCEYFVTYRFDVPTEAQSRAIEDFLKTSNFIQWNDWSIGADAEIEAVLGSPSTTIEVGEDNGRFYVQVTTNVYVCEPERCVCQRRGECHCRAHTHAFAALLTGVCSALCAANATSTHPSIASSRYAQR